MVFNLFTRNFDRRILGAKINDIIFIRENFAICYYIITYCTKPLTRQQVLKKFPSNPKKVAVFVFIVYC